ALQGLWASRLLCSGSRGKNLCDDLSRLSTAINSNDFNLNCTKPLLSAVLANKLDDKIWDQVYRTIIQITLPSRPIALSLQ
ncbi:hypothetical protein F5883DRAFT_700119, partial [Diaporthe sp. PMI_573]